MYKDKSILSDNLSCSNVVIYDILNFGISEEKSEDYTLCSMKLTNLPNKWINCCGFISKLQK